MEKKSSPTIIGILGKSLKTTYRNGKPLLSIMLFVYLILSILQLSGDLVTKQVVQDLSHKSSKIDPNQIKDFSDFDQSTVKDIKFLLLVKLGTLLLSCIALLFFSIGSISSSYAAHTSKILSIKDMLLCVRKRWVAVFITTLYLSLISIAVLSLFFIILTVGSLFTHGFGSYSLKVGASSLLGVVFYIYLSVVWILSIVVSVVEDKCSGLKAIDKAGEILKGKRFKACVIMVLFTIVGIVVYMSCITIAGKLWDKKSARLGVRICTIWSLSFVKLFMFVVYTVFYHECENDENDGAEEEKGKLGLYLPIASGDV